MFIVSALHRSYLKGKSQKINVDGIDKPDGKLAKFSATDYSHFEGIEGR